MDYAQLLPSLFELKASSFYIALVAERERRRVLEIIRNHMKPDQRIFVGVVSPIDPRIERRRGRGAALGRAAECTKHSAGTAAC